MNRSERTLSPCSRPSIVDMVEDLSEVMVRFYDELDRELETTTDRGAVILGVSGLDTLVSHLLNAATVESSGALGGSHFTFASKVEIAFAFGLIAEEERRELSLLGKIRNKTAHEVDASIRTGPLRDQCMELRFCESHFVPSQIPFMEAPDGTKYVPDPIPDAESLPDVQVTMTDPTNPRERYVTSVRALVECLVARLEMISAPVVPHAFGPDEARALLVDGIARSRLPYLELERESDALLARLEQLPDSPEKATLADEVARSRAEIERDRGVHVVGRYGLAVVRESRRRRTENDPHEVEGGPSNPAS